MLREMILPGMNEKRAKSEKKRKEKFFILTVFSMKSFFNYEKGTDLELVTFFFGFFCTYHKTVYV